MKTYENIIPILKAHGKSIGLDINIENPVTIQDKIAWLIVYDSTPLKTKCADKVLLHEYCKEKLGEDICVPLLKTWDSVDDIKWYQCPMQFVVKCNHGSGMNIIVKDKTRMNLDETEDKLREWMSTDFAMKVNCEMHYHDIPRKIMVEKLLVDDKQQNSLFDYKFWCFNGNPKFMTVTDGLGHGTMDFYDMSYNLIDLARIDFKPMKEKVQKPLNFEKMVEYAKKLSEDFKFVRVDFYEVDGKLYLGELTFTPGAGLFRYTKHEDEVKVGEMLKL